MSSLVVFFVVLSIAILSSGVPVPVLVPARQLAAAVQEIPRPYEFGYEFGDGLGMSQHRREVSDANGAVRGRYGYVDPLGVARNVEYIANTDGYRAIVTSNEPGLVSQHTGDVVYVVRPSPPAAIAQAFRSDLKLISV